jgi:hypothetical protein
MHLRSDMVSDKTHDALHVRRGQLFAGISQAFRQSVDPQPTIGIEHHLNDAGIFEPRSDRRPERGAQHSRAARDSFCSK